MKNMLKKKINNKFTKSIIFLTTGTAFAQVLNTFFSPIITRIYSPNEYGILSMYTAILGLLVIISSFRIEMAIPITDDDEKAINTIVASFIILLFFIGLLTVLLIVWGNDLLKMFKVGELIEYKYLLPIGIFFSGVYNIVNQWAIREKKFKSIAKTKLSQSITRNISKIGLGLINTGPYGLIIGTIFGQSAGIIKLSKSLLKGKKNFLKSVYFMNIGWVFKRYIKFPVFAVPSQLLNAVGTQLPVLFISALYGAKEAGFFGLANSIVNIPMIFIGNSIMDVFYGEVASMGKSNPQKIKKLSIKLFKKLILIGLLPLIVIFIFGPILFTCLFGEIWYESGVYARILSLLVFARFIFVPISTVYNGLERQKEAFYLDFLRAVLVISVFIFSNILSLNIYYSIALYSIVMSSIYLISFLVAQKILNEEIIRQKMN